MSSLMATKGGKLFFKLRPDCTAVMDDKTHFGEVKKDFFSDESAAPQLQRYSNFVSCSKKWEKGAGVRFLWMI